MGLRYNVLSCQSSWQLFKVDPDSDEVDDAVADVAAGVAADDVGDAVVVLAT